MTGVSCLLVGLGWILLSFLPASAQQDTSLQFDIFEQFPAPFFVGDIIQTAQLRTKLNATVLNNLRFSILEEGNENAEYFAIGSEDGVIKTKEVIDRDELCPRMELCVLDLDVATHSPPDHFEVIKIKVTISDRNDNAPQFLESEIYKSISESTWPGYSFTIPTADDVDSPQYGVTSYVMTSQSREFELKEIRNDDGTVSNLYIVLKESLDREAREEYHLTVEAKDGGTPALSGALNVHITVLDLNDNFPVFDSDLYVAEVREDTAPGTSIYRVTATDPDAGANGEIVYGFTIKTRHSFGDLFSIKNTTGEISVIGNLDYEETKTCNLQVTARDRSAESLLAESRVIVNIRDVNDNPPKITVNALTASRRVELPESSPAGSFAGYISVNDPDSGENGKYECVLSDPSGKFRVEPQRAGEYKLVSTGRVDHEEESSYTVEFTCRDNGQPSLSSRKVIDISIVDENDNRPEFPEPAYSVVLEENNPVGQEVLVLTAADPDSGKNGEVLYSIAGDGASYLNINPITGNLTASAVLDYEQVHNLTVRVVARDQGQTPLESATIVRVALLDVNDNPPRFDPAQYQFTVAENQEIGTEVGQVTASDKDSLGYNEFQFYLHVQSGSLASDIFTIDPNSGRIFTRKPLDREEVASYDVIVIAGDRDDPTLVSSATVTIDVGDKNDNPPVLRFPSPNNKTLHISKAAPVGYIITQVSAVDRDQTDTDNSRLSFSFIRNSARGDFIIAKDTGAISVDAGFVRSDRQDYELVILVQDNGNPPLATEATLNVIVNKSISFPTNSAGVSGSSLMAGQNLTIVIAVAAISAVLILALIIAIVILRRQEQNRRSNNYLNVLFGDGTKLAESGNNGGGPVKSSNLPNNKNITGNKNNAGYSNKIDINDEVDIIRKEEALYSQVQKTKNNKGHAGHAGISGYWAADAQNLQLKEAGDGDDLSDPAASEAASLNSDSGRGSNEDGDSRPSVSDHHGDYYLRNSQGAGYQHSPQCRGQKPSSHRHHLHRQQQLLRASQRSMHDHHSSHSRNGYHRNAVPQRQRSEEGQSGDEVFYISSNASHV